MNEILEQPYRSGYLLGSYTEAPKGAQGLPIQMKEKGT